MFQEVLQGGSASNEEWELIATFSSSTSITLSKPITDFKKLAFCCIYANSVQGTTIAPIELVKSIGAISVRMGANEILGNLNFTDDINAVAYYEKNTSLNGYFNLYGIK